jgi:hypothetical protein
VFEIAAQTSRHKRAAVAYNVTFEQRSDFLHARVSGTNSRESVVGYMEDVLQECKKRDCFRVLIEERLEGPRLQAMDVFTISSEGSMKVLGIFEAIAYVDEAMGELREFVETVAVNRGLPMAAFATVAEAEGWLERHAAGTDEHRIFYDPNARSE